QFKGGTAGTLTTLFYSVSGGVITQSVNPGVFFYWVAVQASAGANSFTINQAITTGNFDSHFFNQAAGSAVFDPNCVSVGTQSVTTSGGVTSVTFTAASAGTYFIGIKFASKSVAVCAAPRPTTVHYTFSTAGVQNTTSGLDLKLVGT